MTNYVRFLLGRLCFFLYLILALLACASVEGSSPTPAQNGLILRVRMTDGSMQRIQLSPGTEETTSLKEAISVLISNDNDDSDENKKTDDSSNDEPLIRIGASNKIVEDTSQTISSLGLKRGSLITLVKKPSACTPEKQKKASQPKVATNRWDPFPDLAKDYQAAVRKAKTRRATKSGMSYSDIAKLQSSLHKVQAQDVGPITRVYMCAKSAQRFQANCYIKSTGDYAPRIGLLFGTWQRERVDLKPKARTSLSSQTESSQYCSAAKVHALWEPPTQRPTKRSYDSKSIPDFKTDVDLQRVFRVADLLGLRPIGWIFSYNDNRHKDEDSLPVYAPDAKTGALLQIANMQKLGREEGSRFVTLSMQADSGATEAFQLSDVCVQMIAEDLWEMPATSTDDKEASRFVSTKHNVVVDGRETRKLDSVLCLVNTAMLSHDGAFAGSVINSVKKSGGVTNKIKKAILAALDTNDDNKLLETLSDLNILICLDKSLAQADMQQLCTSVSKWARGQKRGTQLDDKLKLLLRSLLDH